MGVGDQHRAVSPPRRGEVVAVDESHPGLDGIDAETSPGHVEERHRRPHAALDPIVGEQAHRAFEHERRARHGVEDVAVLGGRGDEPVDDLGVDVLEPIGRLVDVVEASWPSPTRWALG